MIGTMNIIMADITHKLANRKRGREESDDPVSNDADDASAIPRRKKPQRVAAPTYSETGPAT